jgi:hypothetical protein
MGETMNAQVTYLRALRAELEGPASRMLNALVGSPSSNYSAYFLLQRSQYLVWPIFEYVEKGAPKAHWGSLIRAVDEVIAEVSEMSDEQVREFLVAKYPRHASKF